MILIKDVYGFYMENYKILFREIKEYLNYWRTQGRLIVINLSYKPKLMYKFHSVAFNKFLV